MASLGKLPAEIIDRIISYLPWPEESTLDDWSFSRKQDWTDFRRYEDSDDYEDWSTISKTFKEAFDYKRYRQLYIDTRRLGAFADIVTGHRFLALRLLRFVLYHDASADEQWDLDSQHGDSVQCDKDSGSPVGEDRDKYMESHHDPKTDDNDDVSLYDDEDTGMEIDSDDHSVLDEDEYERGRALPMRRVDAATHERWTRQLNSLFDVLQYKSQCHLTHAGFRLEIVIREVWREEHYDDCDTSDEQPHDFGCDFINRPVIGNMVDLVVDRYSIACVKDLHLDATSRGYQDDSQFWSRRWGTIVRYFPSLVDLSVVVTEPYIIQNVEEEREWCTWIRELPATLRNVCLSLGAGRCENQFIAPIRLTDTDADKDTLSRELGILSQRVVSLQLGDIVLDIFDFIDALAQGPGPVLRDLSIDNLPPYSPKGYYYTTYHPSTTPQLYIWKKTQQYLLSKQTTGEILAPPIDWAPETQDALKICSSFDGECLKFRTVFDNKIQLKLSGQLALLATKVPKLNEVFIDLDNSNWYTPGRHHCSFGFCVTYGSTDESINERNGGKGPVLNLFFNDVHDEEVAKDLKEHWMQLAWDQQRVLAVHCLETFDELYSEA